MEPALKLFLGGLSPSTTQDSLFAHFAQYGEVQDCCLMLDRNTGRSRCFGFVTMKRPEEAAHVLATSHSLDGREIDCKPAVPNKQPSAEEPPDFRTKKLFVGGLPSDVTEDSFQQYFEGFGAIEEATMIYDRNTRRPRGFGFITFTEEEPVEKVLANYSSNLINGKWVECKKATPKQSATEFYMNPYVSPYVLYYPVATEHGAFY